MIPVDQTSLHRPGEPPGNCFAACIASLLHVPLESVPQPVEGEVEHWASYWERLAPWLASRGFYMVLIDAGTAYESSALIAGHAESLRMVGGPSPRGTLSHVVVARGDEIAHDPHPSRAGLAGPVEATMYLVPLDPSRVVRPGLVVSQYTLREARPGFWTEVTLDRMVQRDGRVLWKVSLLGDCLNRNGEWEYEPIPSSRDDAFFARCRFASVEEALEHWERARPLLAAEIRELACKRGVPLPEGLEP